MPILASDLARLRPARSFVWLLVLVGGQGCIVVYYMLPRGGFAAVALLCALNAFAAVAAICAAVRSNGMSRLTWFALAGGMVLSTTANVPNYAYTLITDRQIPFPSPLDGIWLLTYPCFILALFALARHQRGVDYVGQVLDTSILIVGGGTLWWVYVLQPSVHAGGLRIFPHIVSVLFPVMDVLTFAVLVGVLVTSKINASMRLLLASFIVLLASDSLYAVLLAHGTYHTGGTNDGLWMTSYVFLGVAALHPSARSFPYTTAPDDHRVRIGRLLFLGAALLVGPMLLITHPGQLLQLAWPSATAFLLVMSRLAWLNHQLAAASGAINTKTEELRHQALHDSLTGLPNRSLITDRIDQMLARCRRNATIGSALFMDLDDFKNVNDTLGHHAGDRLLVAVADRLSRALREVDTIGRMGGDEFVVLIDGSMTDGGAELVAERLLAVMHQPFTLGGSAPPMMVTISIGIASGDRASADELLRDADVALYQAKGAGKNCIDVFDPQMQSEFSRRTDLEFDLRAALAGNQYRLEYQPIYNLDDLSVIGVEALLRWDHPTRGPVGPDEFVPVLEQTGQIREVGRWVLRSACQQMALWHARGDRIDVSVNVSGRQLDDDSIVTDIRDALQSSGLPASALIIEVTETALMRDASATSRRLAQIKALGARISIDDFGTGYSSLAYLQQFPVDCLKIDRSFVTAATSSPESKALIRTLVQLGKDLGLRTLAEGAETTEELDLLRGVHVDEVQGFLMARPMRADVLEAQLLEPTRSVRPALRHTSGRS